MNIFSAFWKAREIPCAFGEKRGERRKTSPFSPINRVVISSILILIYLIWGRIHTALADNGQTETPPDRIVPVGMIGIWESARGDTLIYADAGDTLSLDIHVNVGTAQANGFELFVAIDNQYLAPITPSTPFQSRGILSHDAFVLINDIEDTGDTTRTYLHYAEVHLHKTATDTGAIASLQLRVIRAIPPQTAAIIILKNDAINQRRPFFTIQGTHQISHLIPRNHIQVFNRPPALTLPDSLSVLEDGELVLNLNDLVEDREFTPDQMTWTITALEPGFAIAISQTPDGQQASIRPPPNWHGQTTLIFRVTDPEGISASKTIALTVVSVNDPPVLSDALTRGLIFDEDTIYLASLDTLATDPDHAPDALAWTVQSGQHVSATIDTLARILRLTPPPDWHGRDTIDVTVTDPEGASDRARIPIEVRWVNDPPAFISLLPALENATGDTLLNLGAYVIDADNPPETLTWRVEGAQTIGARMEAEGLLILTIPGGWAGTEILTITVADPHGASAQATLRVSAALRGDFNEDGQVGFEDFILFAPHFGRTSNDPAFDPRFDLSGNGQIGFDDFLIFAQQFGRRI